MKRFDLMHQINARGTFMVSKFAVPYLEKAANPHILMLSPPLDLREKWFAPNTAYADGEIRHEPRRARPRRRASPASGLPSMRFWPRTTIATSANPKTFRGDAVMRASRTPEILADAARMIFLQDVKTFTGNFLIDDVPVRERRAEFRPVPGRPRRRSGAGHTVPDNPPPVSLKKAAG